MSNKTQKIQITSIGASGDGIGIQAENGKNWYIPATFSGEIVEAEFVAPRGKGVAGKAVKIENPSKKPPSRTM